MALVEHPRNNLQQHLAWFNSTKPQVPPGRGLGDSLPTTTTTANPLPRTLLSQVGRTVQPSAASAPETATMPTPANMRNSTLAAPRRSEVTPRHRDIQDIEVVSPETLSKLSTYVLRKTVTDRFKNDIVRQGSIDTIPTNLLEL